MVVFALSISYFLFSQENMYDSVRARQKVHWSCFKCHILRSAKVENRSQANKRRTRVYTLRRRHWSFAYFCYLGWQLALSHQIRHAPQALVSVMVQNWPVTSLKVCYSYKYKIIASCQQTSWWKSFLAVHGCTGAVFSSFIQDKKTMPCIIFFNCVIIVALKGLDIYYKHLCQRQHWV